MFAKIYINSDLTVFNTKNKDNSWTLNNGTISFVNVDYGTKLKLQCWECYNSLEIVKGSSHSLDIECSKCGERYFIEKEASKPQNIKLNQGINFLVELQKKVLILVKEYRDEIFFANTLEMRLNQAFNRYVLTLKDLNKILQEKSGLQKDDIDKIIKQNMQSLTDSFESSKLLIDSGLQSIQDTIARDIKHLQSIEDKNDEINDFNEYKSSIANKVKFAEEKLKYIKEYRDEIMVLEDMRSEAREEFVKFMVKELDEIVKSFIESGIDETTYKKWINELVNRYLKSIYSDIDIIKLELKPQEKLELKSQESILQKPYQIKK